jgi:serine/threonine-protein kinase
MRRSSLALISTLSFVSLAFGQIAACSDDGGTSSASSNTGGGGASSGASTSSSDGGAGSTGTNAGGGGGSQTSSSSGVGGAGGGSQSAGGIFEAPNAWTKDVSALPKDEESDKIITWLNANGGWGNGNKFQIDFSMQVLKADASVPMRQFTTTADFYSPDCEHVPFPVPANGAIEGEQGYACAGDGDCHLIVIHEPTKTLYEMWRANITGPNVGDFLGGCAVTWDLTKTYPENLRGEGCTSADAGGFPITAMLFSADEVAAGEIPHAIRFILPNARIRDNVYVHPGTHSTGPTSGGPDAPPYGVRFRLKQDFDLASLPSDGARVIAKALQKYGMFLADAGNIALTGQSDRFTTHKWDEVGVTPQSLLGIKVTDMEVVDMGDPIQWSGDCILNPPP